MHTIATAHPEYDITILLRKVPEAFSSTYPKVKVVGGDYDSFELIANNACAADIVVHNGSSDHEASLNAILVGLLKRKTPGYLLHLSGTGIVSDWAQTEQLGKLNPKVWSDVSSLDEIRALPATALHRNTETILNSAVRDHSDKINIAIMCPPDIYGKGRGPVRTQSALVPIFVRQILYRGGKAFYHAEGTNARSWVHIDDLTRLYLRVVEAAASGDGTRIRTREYFNENGYYFAGTQEHSHVEIARAVGRVLHGRGLIADPTPVRIGLEDLDQILEGHRFGRLARYLFASNSRTRPDRAEKLFGYGGEAPGLMECLEEDVLAAVG